MKFLVDTCVVTGIRNPKGDTATKAVFVSIPDESMFLSVLSIGELTKGIAMLSTGKKKKHLASWLRGLEDSFADRILSVDHETTRLWGELTARAARQGVAVPAIDGLLAATALQHGLHVMTRNIRHFRGTGALLFDPANDSTE